MSPRLQTRAERAARLWRQLRRSLHLRPRNRALRVRPVRFGSFGRLTPISRQYGFDRGMPIDRYYIEDFLRRHGSSPGYGQGDIRGTVLEVGGDEYARRFGGWRTGVEGPGSPVTALDVLHADSSNPQATIVGDLASGEGIPSCKYDCVICTQTLHVIYNVADAVDSLHRMLRPGGVVLVTVAGISQASRPDRDLWGDYWRFTTLSAARLFEGSFPAAGVRVEAYGNVLTSIAFLHGLAAEELDRDQLETRDPDYELLVAIRAVKEQTPDSRANR